MLNSEIAAYIVYRLNLAPFFMAVVVAADSAKVPDRGGRPEDARGAEMPRFKKVA